MIKSENDLEFYCKDCNDPFTFSEGEQKFYTEHGYTPPKRCKSCRLKKKRGVSKYE